MIFLSDKNSHRSPHPRRFSNSPRFVCGRSWTLSQYDVRFIEWEKALLDTQITHINRSLCFRSLLFAYFHLFSAQYLTVHFCRDFLHGTIGNSKAYDNEKIIVFDLSLNCYDTKPALLGKVHLKHCSKQ